jgi:hypothetical protein
VHLHTRTILVFGGSLLMSASLASAQSRTWVSGVGDDVNPCSRTAPCKTFAGAIAKTNPGGEISVLDNGSFGAVTITKAITISGAGTHASVLTTGTNGITIVAGANDVVTLHNLQLQGLNGGGLIGVRMGSGKALVMQDVRIMGFQTAVQAEAGNTFIDHSEFTNSKTVALHSINAASLAVENSVISENVIAVQPDLGSTIRLSNNAVYDNQTGFACGTGGTLASAGNNRKANNVGGAVPTCTPTVMITIQ